MGCGSSRSADPFVLAAEGSISALAQWLDNGGSVDAIDGVKGRGSLLQVAARHDQVECIKLLLKCGASVNLATPEHGTALHAAASAGASNAVPLLLANGASTAARLNGCTAAELAEQKGFPATANLIRMSEPDPSVRGGGTSGGAAAAERIGSGGASGGGAAAERVGSGSMSQLGSRGSGSIHPRERALAAQQATAAKLREIEQQLSAVGAEQQAALLEGGRHASAELTGSGALPSPGSRPHSPHPQQPWRPSPGSSLRPAGSVGSAAAAPGSRQLSTQLPPSQQGAAAPQPGGLSDKELQELVDRAQRRASQAMRQHSTEAAAGGAAAPPNGQALGGGGGSFGAPRPAPSLPRINSRQSLAGGEEESEGLSGSSNSSGTSSLVNDPLLEFVRRAMLSKQPSTLSTTSPFAAAAASAAAIDAPAAGAQQVQQPATPPPQQQQQQGGGEAAGGAAVVAAAPSAAAAAPPGAPPQASPDTVVPGAPSALPPSGRTSSTDLLGGGRPSGGGSTPQPSRGSGSMSLGVDIRPWEIQFEDLALQKTIGEGSFGKVYVAKWHETLVAVKVLLDLEEAQKAAGPEAAWTLSNPILFNLQKECGLMASLRHPNVVQFMGVSAIPPAMVTEYCAKGSLADVLKAGSASTQKAAQLTWLRRLNMALDATKGMLYLHKRGIIHRDLKSPNLLVESTWKVKVADFNLSKIVEDTGSGRSTIANMNPRWLAPEILNGEPATTASDVFSWGVVMWELLTFKLPWPHLVGKLMDGLRLRIPPREELPGPDTDRFVCLEEYLELMQRCWAQAPEDRPSFEEVIHDLRKMLEVQARSMEK